MELNDILLQQILNALKKPPLARSYDDLLLLKAYISKTEFITKDLAGVVNPRQMNDICRSLGLEVYRVGEIIFNQGDPGDKVFIILTGKCEVRIRYRIDLTQGQSEIREKHVVTYATGQFFGERALKYDEPRSASVICIEEDVQLITLHKSVYLEVLQEAKLEEALPALKPEQIGTKEGVVKILSKVREKRTPQELDGVASYLYRRIPFFQKFNMPHLIELCRVADSITIWGRSILFKQGQIGQAFYVILTGTVEVWVQDNISAAGGNSNRHQRSHDLTDGLGAKVNQLVTGDVFGERALENETSQRMASIITGEDSTELIVIAKEDYLNLVYVMMHEDSMHKVQLLRRTELFNSLDIVHLRALSRFMEPKKFVIDEEILTTGKKATELLIIEKGECRVVTEIQEGYEKLTADQKYKLHHKRYMEQTHHVDNNNNSNRHTPENGSPRADNHHLTPIHPTPRRGHHEVQPRMNNNHNPGNRSSRSPEKIQEVHKLLRHTPVTEETDEVLDLSAKEIRKKSLQFAERLKESMGIMTTSSHSRPNTRSQLETTTTDSNNSPSPPHPGAGAARRQGNRFRSVDLNLIGKRKKIDLGRIAPNSILATYVLATDHPHQDVYHLETVIAASLVTAYTVGKHDFFNHMPKDSLEAIVKRMKDYKPPILNPLWENAPRVLDENQWKMEKVWERFRHQVSQDLQKDVNILDTMKVISRRHISMSSGNDPNSKGYVSRLDDLLAKSEAKQQKRVGKGEVDMNWGLVEDVKGSEEFYLVNQHTKSNVIEVPEDQLVTRLPFSMNQQTTSHPKVKLEPIQTKLGPNNTTATSNNNPPPLAPLTPSAAMMVSSIIRNRINAAQQGLTAGTTKIQPLSMSTVLANPVPRADSHDTAGGWTVSTTASTSRPKPKYQGSNTLDYPFALIHIHREVPPSNPMQFLGQKRRQLRTYLRVNGIFPTCAKAKQMADTFMEQIYLKLFQNLSQDKASELLLQWNTFKGYESIDVHDTDLFFIYCRSVPVEFASLRPAKNIFNAKYPALCKSLNQRFAVIVVNELQERQVMQQASRASTPWDPKHPSQSQNASFEAIGAENHDVYQDPKPDDDDDEDEDEETAKQKAKALANRHSIRPRRRPPPSTVTSSSTNNMNALATATSPTATNPTATTAAAVVASTSGSDNPVVGIPTGSDRIKHLSSNDLHQLKQELTANGLSMPDFVTRNKPTMSATITMPLYMKEISVVYEVVTVCPSRLESIRYAIHRFGTVERADAMPFLNLIAQGETQTAATNKGKTKGMKSPVPGTAGNGMARTSPSKTINIKAVSNFQQFTSQTQYGKLINARQRRGLDDGNHTNNNEEEEEEAGGDPNNLDQINETGSNGSLPSDGEDNDDDNEDDEEDEAVTRRRRNSNVAFAHDIYDPSIDSMNENPFLHTKLYLRAYQPNQNDRILKLLSQDPTGKRLCILPLYKWIYINEDTIQTLDFLKIFDEAAIKRIYLAEEFEAIHQNVLQQTPGLTQALQQPDPRSDKMMLSIANSTNKVNQQMIASLRHQYIQDIDIAAVAGAVLTDYSDIDQVLVDRNIEPSLVKSFSEAGLVAAKTLPSGKEAPDLALSRSVPEFLPSDKTKALEILENEMLTRELSGALGTLKSQYQQQSQRPITPNTTKTRPASASQNNREKEKDNEVVVVEEEQETEEQVLVSKSGGLILDISELQAMSGGGGGGLSSKTSPYKHQLGGSSNKLMKKGASSSALVPAGNATAPPPKQNPEEESKNQAAQRAMLIEQRLKTLNASASEQMKIVHMHEKLLLKESNEMRRQEHRAQREEAAANKPTDSSRSILSELTTGSDNIAGGNGTKSNQKGKANRQSLHNTGTTGPPMQSFPFNPYQQQNSPQKHQLMKERLHVIESLQRIPSATGSGNGSGGIAASSPNHPVPGYSQSNSMKIPSKKKGGLSLTNSTGSSNQSQVPQIETTAVGKRLAESLRVLADTLDSQYRR